MKALLKKVVIATVLMSLGFIIASCSDRSEVAKATVPRSAEWEYEKVLGGKFLTYVLTDPDTGIQYIVVYDVNSVSGYGCMAITPRLIQQP